MTSVVRGVSSWGCSLLILLGSSGLATGSASAALIHPQPEIRLWSQPGSRPCGTACGREWALAEMAERGVLPGPVHAAIREQIQHGRPSEYFVTTGDYMPAMSYAIGGVPYMSTDPLVASFGEDRYRAVGYSVLDGETIYRFVRVDACGNWTLVVDNAEETGPATLLENPPFVASDALLLQPIAFAWPGWMVGSGPVIDTGGRGPDKPGSPRPPIEHPLPIPLPLTALLLASALASLAWHALRGVARRNATG